MYCYNCGRTIQKGSDSARTLIRYGTDGKSYGAPDLCSVVCENEWIEKHPFPAGVTAR